MSDIEITEAEVDKFKEFMNEYANMLGVAKSVVAELINDKFVRKLLQQAKKYNWEQLRSINTNSFSGVDRQIGLLLMRDFSRNLARTLKVGGPAVALFGSIYADWTGEGIPNETAKTLTQLALGAVIGGIFAAFPIVVPITLAGIAGYYVEKYWDDGIDLLSDGFAFLFQKLPYLLDDSDIVRTINTLFSEGSEVRSPLVVDLDGDGVETVSAENGVYFDHDGNGFKENSGWASADDGILVRDINANGEIDNGSELFGNNTVLSNGQKAVNGMYCWC